MDVKNIAKETDDKIEEMIKKLTEAHDNIEGMMKKIQEQGDEVNEEIDQHYDELVEKLMKQKNQIKQQVNDIVTQKKKALTVQLDSVEQVQVEMEGLKMKNDSLEKASDNESYLKHKQYVTNWLQKIECAHEKATQQPVEINNITFKPSKSGFPEFCHLCIGSILVEPGHELLIPKYVCVNKETTATLLTQGLGNPMYKGNKQVSVHLETSTGEVTTAQVQDNSDGSYTASFVGKQVGNARLKVSVDGKQIKGSPYSLVVCRNYESLNMPNNIIEGAKILGQPQGIAFGWCGMYAVADQMYRKVCLFDCQNQLVRKIDKDVNYNVMLIACNRVAFDADNCLYVTGSSAVKKFDIHGNCLLQFGGSDSGDGQLMSSQGITTHNGRVYVADPSNKHIAVFKCNGQFCMSIGSGQLSYPYDVTVNVKSQLLVADYSKHCVVIFNLDGHFIGTFGTESTYTPNIYNPNSIATDTNGFTFVTDRHYRVVVFDQCGNFIHSFTGSRGPNYDSSMTYGYVYTVAVSPDGTVFVTDRDAKTIQIFSDY